MTIPWLENCPHTGSGWCGECVKELGQENWTLREQLAAATRDREAGGPDFDLLHELRDRHIPWSLSTFGPGKRTVGISEHIRSELLEIAANPDDVYEWIDVAILALDGAWRCGGSAEVVAVALWHKLHVIRQRHYEKPTSEDVPSYHTKAAAEPAANAAQPTERKDDGRNPENQA